VLPTRQLVEAYARAPGTLLSVMEVAPEDAHKYGIVIPGADGGVSGLVEKPAAGTEPSLMASIGRYILEPEILGILRNQPPGKGGEIQLADAINTQAIDGRVRAVPLKGQRYDCGSKMGYLEATVDFALADPRYAGAFRAMVEAKLAE
jgi:UTP--glucose-1-phosphate uridylyltransferase